MHAKAKEKRPVRAFFLGLLLLALLAGAALGGLYGLRLHRRDAAPPPEEVFSSVAETLRAPAAETAWGQLVSQKAEELCSLRIGVLEEEGRWACSLPLELRYLDGDKLAQGIEEQVSEQLTQAALLARRPDEVYTDTLSFKEELSAAAFEQALAVRLEEAEDCLSSRSMTLRFSFRGDAWVLDNREELEELFLSCAADWDLFTRSLYEAAVAGTAYVPVHYKIDEDALAGPVPDESGFLETQDPAEIQALLETPQARALIGEQSLAWNADIAFLPGSSLYCYLDESLLVLVWQEETSLAVGTYSEVFIADGSQLRRRIAGDAFEDFHFETTSAFAAKTNAVLALGGDFYHHGRSCGVVVYQRDIYRFHPYNCDSCYITADGDMLFSYLGDFDSQEQAQTFIEENDVVFSLCFGPVLIDNGQDVTPATYPWGEVNSEYARSVLGMLGEKHYLTININCQMPDYYYLVTLRQAADAAIAKGCIKAYALDGGQTATTVFHGKLINPVQFGWEKQISDVIYFASAIPNE